MRQKNTLSTKKNYTFHPFNKHRGNYDFNALIEISPDLATFVHINAYNTQTIDFANADAVLALNKALLKLYYNIEFWEIPPQYLCPPIPGRADYIHHIAELLGSANKNIIPKGKQIRCLDIGVGANCIYPIIGVCEYLWSFVGSDIDTLSLDAAKKIIESNHLLEKSVELRLQSNACDTFRGIIRKDEFFDISICNPPFHKSLGEANAGTQRKLSNLNGQRTNKLVLNFGGKSNELWCDGGEEKFVQNMITQSIDYRNSCLWFSSLISKEETLKPLYNELKRAKVFQFKTISMAQGNKKSRILAWTFQNNIEQQNWVKSRWQ